MKGTMKAWRLHKTTPKIGEGLQLETVPIPEISPRDVLIDVKASGLCGSDIHFIDGSSILPAFPTTLGHETAGLICEVGSEVKDYKIGDRVCANFAEPCGRCYQCQTGRPSICPNKRLMGITTDGAYAEYVRTAESTLIRLPDNVPFDQGAAATDAVATPFHMIKRSGMQLGDSVAIFGLGGLGSHAVELARLHGAGLVIGVDVDNHICERAKNLFDADVVINSREQDAVAEIHRLTGGGADISIEVVGMPASQLQAVNCLRFGGRALMAGLGAEPVALPIAGVFVRREWEAVGCYAFENIEIEKIIHLASRGRLDLSKTVTSHIRLEDIGQGLDDLHHKRGYPIRIVAMQD
jgi:2-desacetyl-2-hydroxyethyl bacteriochlorophyllide A dehydrogenase